MSDVRWLHPPQHEPGPALICFPVAGAPYSSLRSWYLTPAPPTGPSVHVVSLPGRGRRVREPAYTSMKPLIDDVAEALAPVFDQPFALYGHSMGALCAHALAVHLHRAGKCRPVQLFVSGQVAPHVRTPLRVESMNDAALAQFLTVHDMLPAAVRAEPDLAALVLTAIRADLRVCDTYTPVPGEPLDVPITAFTSRGDTLTDPAGVAMWRSHTTAAFTNEHIEGSHILTDDEAHVILDRIRAAWRARVPARARRSAAEVTA
ncbi:alpha/beta fold hydrolase [Dactylosporangium sp. NPDC051485]|uniref:thioesterase II family protein n=1 Tax=Dactylosporangium sp. NPDC051485 TaxID=3154846 RepID=UPI00341675D7